MDKLMPYVLLMAMIGMLVLSWKNVAGYYGSINKSYQSHIENAEIYESKKIYIDAVGEYEAALRIRPDDYAIAMKVVELYEELHDGASYAAACENAISADRTQADPYIKLADYYLMDSDFSKALDVLMRARESVEENSEVLERIKTIKGRYTLEMPKFTTSSSFYFINDAKTGYAVIADDTYMGLQEDDRSIVVSPEDGYEYVGILSDDVIPVKKDGEWYYINDDGYRKLVPDRTADYLGSFINGYAPAEIDGVYGYLDKEMEEHHFEFEFAGNFSNNMAAVQKDGKWAVIGSDFSYITEFIFDEILLDENNICSAYGVFFAKQDGKYFLYNAEGVCLSEGYEDAKLFASDEPAAVKSNGKWGFLSKEGELVIEPAYEDADSFSLNYAPYCEKGKWGCIDQEGTVLIEPTFASMKPFAKNGTAVAEEGGMQKYVVVTIYE